MLRKPFTIEQLSVAIDLIYPALQVAARAVLVARDDQPRHDQHRHRHADDREEPAS
jgi:hypothetical protein